MQLAADLVALVSLADEHARDLDSLTTHKKKIASPIQLHTPSARKVKGIGRRANGRSSARQKTAVLPEGRHPDLITFHATANSSTLQSLMQISAQQGSAEKGRSVIYSIYFKQTVFCSLFITQKRDKKSMDKSVAFACGRRSRRGKRIIRRAKPAQFYCSTWGAALQALSPGRRRAQKTKKRF